MSAPLPAGLALGDIGEVIVAAFVAGVGVTAIFSVALLGVSRAAEARREGRGGGAWTLLAVLGAIAVVAVVGLGLKTVAG